MTQKFSVSDIIPAGPDEIYAAWLDGKAHSAMTGAAAKASPAVGGKFSAWDGYAHGTNVELVPGRKIVQSWRTTEFAESDPDSKITVTLKPVAGGTKITLVHSGIPDGQAGYREGWADYYFTPMKAYFAKAKQKAKTKA